MFTYEAYAAGVPVRRVLLCESGLLIAGHLGARLHTLIERGGPWTLHALMSPGYHQPGAIIALLIVMPILRRLLLPTTPLGVLGDCLAPAFAFSTIVIRLSCLGVGCCFGTVSTLPWALRYPPDSVPSDTQAGLGLLPSPHLQSLPVHPLPLYFLLLSLAVGLVCLWLLGHKRYDGQVFLWFLVLHEGGKSLLESFRQDITPGSDAVPLPLVSFLVAAAATGVLLSRAHKGRKDRIAYTSNGSLHALQAWLGVRGPETGPLFIPIMKGGRLVVRRLIAHAIYKMVQKRARQAGVKAFSPHDLRRTFVSDLLDAGADIASTAMRKAAAPTGVQLIDAAVPVAAVCPVEPCPDWFYPDHHPTAAGYRLMAEEVVRSIGGGAHAQ